MTAVAIAGSSCTGHGAYPPRATSDGQSLHTINGTPIHVDGGSWPPHAKPKSPPHGGSTVASSNHTINGQKVALVGDPVSCGSSIATGEPLHTIG